MSVALVAHGLAALRQGRSLVGAVPGEVDSSFGLWDAAAVVGCAAGVYHGYRRNHGSIGWALGWGLLGVSLPIVSIPLSLAEGFGKPEASE